MLLLPHMVTNLELRLLTQKTSMMMTLPLGGEASTALTTGLHQHSVLFPLQQVRSLSLLRCWAERQCAISAKTTNCIFGPQLTLAPSAPALAPC